MSEETDAAPEVGGAGAAQAAPAEGAAQEMPSLEEVLARKGALEARMEELRAATEAEVLKAWTSPWRGADAVRAKVDARLASNGEFRTALTKARELTVLEAQLDPNYVDANAGRQAGGHPAIGR
ncbi:MAG TPA: hypothetical protein VFW71_09345 [Actinomycetota bacterium]|nr:hypothetical protein [Actinomycetota bacterium]